LFQVWVGKAVDRFTEIRFTHQILLASDRFLICHERGAPQALGVCDP
jgi:hypothetical protein